MAKWLVLILGLGFMLPADAQFNWGQPNKNDSSKNRAPNPAARFSDTVLIKEESLPDLPRFSGQVAFLNGYTQETERWKTLSMTYHCKEQPDKVYEWYKQAVENYGWKIAKAKSSMITGNKGSNHCAILVRPAKFPGFNTQLTLAVTTYYKEKGR